MGMTPIQLKKKVRACKQPREQIAFHAGVSYSWLSKFMLDKFENPRKASLDKLSAYFAKTE